MNCLEFRRAALADPRSLDGKAGQHVLECAACREFHLDGLRLEARLRRALRIAIPEAAQERAVRIAGAPQRRLRWAALAAILVFGLAAALLWGGPRNDPLALASIDFIGASARSIARTEALLKST